MKYNKNMEDEDFLSSCSKINGSIHYLNNMLCLAEWSKSDAHTVVLLIISDYTWPLFLYSQLIVRPSAPFAALNTKQVDLYEIDNLDNDGCNFSCLVAVGRLHPRAVSQQVPNHIKRKPIEFVSRHAIDGMFGFVDHRSVLLPQHLFLQQHI